MKKTLFLACSLGLLLGACSKDDVKDTVSDSISTYNLVTNAQGAASVSNGSYQFNFDRIKATVQLSASDLALTSTNKVGFTTTPIAYTAGTYVSDAGAFSVARFSSADPAADVKNLSCVLTTGRFRPSENVEGYGVSSPLSSLGYYPVMSYDYDGYNVRTFWPDMTFIGSTITTMPGAAPFETSEIEYRVVMNLKDPANFTADVFLLKARFAQAMPVSLNIALRGLPLTFSQQGFTIEAPGEMSPETIGDGGFLTNDKYKFNSFKLVSSRDLTGVQVEYRVMDVFSGSFSGTCVLIPDLN